MEDDDDADFRKNLKPRQGWFTIYDIPNNINNNSNTSKLFAANYDDSEMAIHTRFFRIT